MYRQTTPKNADEPEVSGHGLFIHSKRREWGVAMIAWEHHNKRGYQFEDGTLRVFRKGFYPLFEVVNPSPERAKELAATLNTKLERSRHQQKTKKTAKKKVTPAPWSFASQVRIFRHLYPGGFQDPAWLEKMRGVGVNRRLKRHRQPAIDAAQKAFASKRLADMVAAERFDDITTLAINSLKETNLVNSTHLKPLQTLEPLQQRAFALALNEMFHGEGSLAQRFKRLYSALKGNSQNASWQLATALLTLFDPEQYICVNPSAFRKQLPETKPTIHIAKHPDGGTFKRLCAVGAIVKTRLEKEGLQPKDMLDIYDFIAETLRPSAEKVLKDVSEK